MSASSDSSESDMVKPNSTITTRHKDDLDELVPEYYSSRSEALRAAIDLLCESVKEGDNLLELLINRVEDLADELREIKEEIREDDSEDDLLNQYLLRELNGGNGAQAKNVTQDEIRELHRIVSDIGPASPSDVAEQTELDLLTVREGLHELENKPFISVEKDGQTPKYNVKIMGDAQEP